MPDGEPVEGAMRRTPLTPDQAQGRVAFDHLSHYEYSGPLAGVLLTLTAVIALGGHGHIFIASVVACGAALKHLTDAPSLWWDAEHVTGATTRSGRRESTAREVTRMPWAAIVGASAARSTGRDGTRDLLILHLDNGDRVAPLVLADHRGRSAQMRAFIAVLRARGVTVDPSVDDFVARRSLPKSDEAPVTAHRADARRSSDSSDATPLPWTFRMDDEPDEVVETWHQVTARDDRGRLARWFGSPIAFPVLTYSEVNAVGVMVFAQGTWEDAVVSNRHLVLDNVQRVTVERGIPRGPRSNAVDDAGVVLHLANGTHAAPLALVDERRDTAQALAFLDLLSARHIPVAPEARVLVDPGRGMLGDVARTPNRERSRG